MLVKINCDENNIPNGFEEIPGTRFWCGAHWGVEAVGKVKEVKSFAFGEGVEIDGEIYPCTPVK